VGEHIVGQVVEADLSVCFVLGVEEVADDLRSGKLGMQARVIGEYLVGPRAG
jgi:hypothetical protein